MPQGPLAFKYEAETTSTGATALAGLPAYLDLAKVLGLASSVREYLREHENAQGWTAAQIVSSLTLLQLAGGDCVDDLKILEADDGFGRVLRRVEQDLMGLPRAERRRMEMRWRKEKKRSVPSPSATRRFLNLFDVDESGRVPGKSWIAAVPDPLQALRNVNRDLVASIDKADPQSVATLDVDATLKEVFKKDAVHCYKGFKAYQPLNVYWAEHDVVLHSEFRDGNVPAGFEILRVLQDGLEFLPEGVQKVCFRSDSAAYQTELLLYLSKGEHPRFGVIEFSISVDVTPQFRAAVAQLAESDWKPVLRPVTGKDGKVDLKPTGHEYAEVCYTTNELAHSKRNPDLRFVAIRQRLGESDASRLGAAAQLTLPFPVEQMDGSWYKLHGIVTNRLEMPADELILWHWARCGKSEEAHAVMKEDLAGGQLPSGRFGPNAAWWAIMILAFNLNSAMKRLVLGGNWVTQRLKALRFGFICVAGRVIEHARQLIVRLSSGHPTLGVLEQARRRMYMLAAVT